MRKLTISKKALSAGLLGLAFVVSCHLAAGVFGATGSNEVSKEIDSLNRSIQQKKGQLNTIKSKQDQYRREIEQIQSQQASLENQLALVDNRMAESQLQLDQVKIDIETTNLEIQRTALEIVEQDKKITDNKGRLGSALKILSQEDGKSQLEILLLNDYLTDYINQVKYLENINEKITGGLTDLRSFKDQLEINQEKLNASREKLRVLQKDLQEKQVALATEKDTKTFLLDQTKSSEAEYQSLLAAARSEQQSAAADIASLERSVRAKINSQAGEKVPLSYDGFIWPVPKNTVTAFFHDPSYPFRNIFEHPAIDVRAAQGTPIRAAGSGYVGRAKDAGMGYSYIMLVHGNELATVYGHVSKIYVREDEYVTQGQVIGLSGAMPGTPGAGPLTTGPHLHLEVRKGGIPVDPLQYLP